MLKITQQRGATSHSLFLVLEGRLAGPWVEELDAYCRKMSEDDQHCAVLDLTGVTFVDTDGKSLLARLWEQGAELRASGCLTRCVVDEITGASRIDPSNRNRDKLASKVPQNET
jgi:anti-anti-sigma regulatory factor